jgi:hypothetical protein
VRKRDESTVESITQEDNLKVQARASYKTDASGLLTRARARTPHRLEVFHVVAMNADSGKIGDMPDTQGVDGIALACLLPRAPRRLPTTFWVRGSDQRLKGRSQAS